MKCLPALLAMLVTISSVIGQVHAQEVIFLIRHAERDWSSSDAGLVDAGRERAVGWAEVLSDANLDVIVTSEMMRTRETGALIASVLKLPTIEVPRSDHEKLLRLLKTEFSDDRVLIVGHSSTVPQIVQRLGHPMLFHIAKSDYNDLFVVEPSGQKPPSVIRLNVE
ncbi:SixA phosphatase family protein [Tropicimonas aquimaris]|uniref:SixA phosphatase family protein n=1 Tax=Tropicimonas aquimaris TaxID=914152 RepID=A0ABW3IJR6_9RHOB